MNWPLNSSNSLFAERWEQAGGRALGVQGGEQLLRLQQRDQAIRWYALISFLLRDVSLGERIDAFACAVCWATIKLAFFSVWFDRCQGRDEVGPLSHDCDERRAQPATNRGKPIDRNC